MNKVKTLEEFSSQQFDKEHSKFYKLVFIRFMKEIEKKFISKFEFQGDERFTKAKQRIFFKGCFENGASSVTNILPLKYWDNEEVNNALKLINKDPIKALKCTATHFDETNRIVKGVGFTGMRNNISRKVFNIDNENSAFLMYDSNYDNGYERFLPFAYFFATNEVILKKRLTLTDKKFASNTANNNNYDSTLQDIYDTTKSFLALNPSQTSSLTNDQAMLIKVENMLSEKIAKADMSSGETLNDIFDFMEQHKNVWMHLLGIRVNVNKKSDRNISDEFTSEEVHFKLVEKDFKDQLEMFMDDYEKVHGIRLTLVDLEQETLDEIAEQQVKVAGQANNDGDKDKGGKDE